MKPTIFESHQALCRRCPGDLTIKLQEAIDHGKETAVKFYAIVKKYLDVPDSTNSIKAPELEQYESGTKFRKLEISCPRCSRSNVFYFNELTGELSEASIARLTPRKKQKPVTNDLVQHENQMVVSKPETVETPPKVEPVVEKVTVVQNVKRQLSEEEFFAERRYPGGGK